MQKVQTGFRGLSEQLEFLSPLKISGNKSKVDITGAEIFEFVKEFFHLPLTTRGITFEASVEFRALMVFEMKSRLLPVFINLVDNSIYWLVHGQVDEPRIRFSVSGEKVIVSDNGPGVQEGEVRNLFKLFHTTKTGSGRGVGLYLSRTNLAIGGHRIDYVLERDYQVLPGANFMISLSGVEFESSKL